MIQFSINFNKFSVISKHMILKLEKNGHGAVPPPDPQSHTLEVGPCFVVRKQLQSQFNFLIRQTQCLFRPKKLKIKFPINTNSNWFIFPWCSMKTLKSNIHPTQGLLSLEEHDRNMETPLQSILLYETYVKGLFQYIHFS